MTALINVRDGKKKGKKRKVTMSSSHSGLLKDSLDRLVHLKDIKHCCHPHFSLLELFFFGFLFYPFLNLADFPFLQRQKDVNEKEDIKLSQRGRS